MDQTDPENFPNHFPDIHQSPEAELRDIHLVPERQEVLMRLVLGNLGLPVDQKFPEFAYLLGILVSEVPDSMGNRFARDSLARMVFVNLVPGNFLVPKVLVVIRCPVVLKDNLVSAVLDRMDTLNLVDPLVVDRMDTLIPVDSLVLDPMDNLHQVD